MIANAASRPRAPARYDMAFGAALFVLAFLPRIYVALGWAGEPVWDGHYYDFGARRIAEGLGYSDDLYVEGLGFKLWHPWCHYPVGYSGFLAIFYRLFGANHHVAAFANAGVGALLALITWLLARHALSPLRAKLAGALVALHPGLILYSALVMTEPLAALLTLVAFLVAVRDRLPLRGIALGALTLGIGALVRPQALLCAPFLALVILRPRSDSLPFSFSFVPSWLRAFPPLSLSVSRFLILAAFASVVALLPVLPWTARNCRVMDGCALVSTNAGWNLAIGAFPRATGRFETLRSSDGCREVTGQVQQDRCWLEYGVAQIKAHPGHWLSLIPAKLAYTFDHESFAVEYLHEARPDAWPEARRVLARNVLTVFHLALVCGAALGCVAFRRRGAGARAQGVALAVLVVLFSVAVRAGDNMFWPLACFAAIVPWLPLPGRAPWPAALLLPVVLLASTIVTHAVFFGEDRYHVVVSPVLCLLASCALRRERAIPRRE